MVSPTPAIYCFITRGKNRQCAVGAVGEAVGIVVRVRVAVDVAVLVGVRVAVGVTVPVGVAVAVRVEVRMGVGVGAVPAVLISST